MSRHRFYRSDVCACAAEDEIDILDHAPQHVFDRHRLGVRKPVYASIPNMPTNAGCRAADPWARGNSSEGNREMGFHSGCPLKTGPGTSHGFSPEVNLRPCAFTGSARR
jgi:hypothetical protein